MFRVHLRAVLRASAYGKAQLLLPMVTGVEEIRRAREILEEEKEVLRRRRVAFCLRAAVHKEHLHGLPSLVFG